MKKSDLIKIEEKLFSHSLGSKMGHTVKAMLKKMAERFSMHDLDLTPEQVYVLIILNEEKKLILQDLAEIMSKDKSAVFRHIESLEKKHLVARMTSADDKRKKVLMLTQKGMKKLNKVKEIQSNISEEITYQVEPKELEIFENVLQKIYANAIKN
ncbi:MAG TPA: MarR family transcriptional regulator [Balneolaceae bacterium]